MHLVIEFIPLCLAGKNIPKMECLFKLLELLIGRLGPINDIKNLSHFIIWLIHQFDCSRPRLCNVNCYNMMVQFVNLWHLGLRSVYV